MINVLIVDDSAPDAALTMRALGRTGVMCASVAANDADEALSLLGESEFDLVLLDMNMPCTDGFELLERLCGRDRTDARIIAVSGSRSIDYQRRALALGALDFIHKSVDFDEFLEKIKSTLSRHSIL